MSLLNVLDRMIGRPLSSRRGPRRSPVRRRQPRALAPEPLEDRLCPSGWTSIGPYGSPTFAEVIDPSHPDTIYTGSEGAGVRKSTDGGATWSAMNTGLPAAALNVYGMLLDPTHPQTLYAGTYKTTDGGEHWTQTALTGTLGSFAIDPSDGTLYAGAQGAAGVLYRSTDGGVSWQQADNGIVGIPNFASIAVDPLHPGTLYVGTQGTSGTSILGEGVFKSTDHGGHWSLVLPSTSGVAVALDPGDPQIVYAGNADGVFKSYDGGDTWFRPIGLNFDAVASLIVDSAHPHTLYAGTLHGGVFQSTDGAATWHSSGLSTELIISLAVNPTDSNTVYAGTGTGPYVSHNAGASWSPLDDDLRTNCACYGVEGLTVDPTDSSVIYMNSLDGGGFVTRDGGATWSPLTAGLASSSPKHITFDPHDPNVVYSGSNSQTGPGGVFNSTDGGQTWSRLSLGPSGIYVWTLGEDPNDSNTLYAGTKARGLFKTTDAGANWTPVNNGLTSLNPMAVVVDLRDSRTVYVGTAAAQGGLFKSIDGGNNWLHSGLDGNQINSLSIDPQNSQIIYAGLGPNQSRGFWKSIDGGQSWFNILPNVTVSRSRGILIDPTDSNTLYVGTEGGGVFMSTDGGDHWTAINAGLTNLRVLAMAMDPQDPHTIYAGTNGDSVFVLHVTAPAVVQSVVVNDGSAQRSMVTSLTVAFSTVVHLDPGAFALVRQGGGGIDLSIAEAVVDGHSVDTLTFVGAGIIGGSLADGSYTLVTHAGLIHDDLGRGLAGGDRTDAFFRLFGDGNGDGRVDVQDLLRFAGTFGKRAGDPGYLAYFDYDGNGTVDLTDLDQFLRRFGR
jgi:photosystem II stability/assembly factor-like uncharacterized protein